MKDGTADCARFAHDDAVYLLGALDPAGQRAFEDHLVACPRCRAHLARLRTTVAALESAGPEALATHEDGAGSAEIPTEVPDTLLPNLIAQVTRLRRRRRWSIAALGGVAAAAVVALVITLSTHVAGGPSSTLADAGTPMTATSSQLSLRAVATLTGESWGTRISVDCYYSSDAATSGYLAAPARYSLRVTAQDGSHHELGSWALSATGETRFTSGIAVPTAQIRTVMVVRPDGTPVLRLDPQ